MKTMRACAAAGIVVAMVSQADGDTKAAGSAVGRRPQLVDRYTAYIATDDLFNAAGERLTLPWQILRQDRVNFHVNGFRQRDDESDRTFLTPTDRSRFEYLVQKGRLSARTAAAIAKGNVAVRVEVWGRGDVGDYVVVQIE